MSVAMPFRPLGPPWGPQLWESRGMPDYALLRIARTALVPLSLVRNHYAGRWVGGWARRRIEWAEDRERNRRRGA